MSGRKTEAKKRQQYWLEHIRAADASDGSLVAYAAAHDLNVKDLYRWKTTLSRRGVLPGKARKGSFVAVSTPPTMTMPGTSCSITLPNGVRLQIAGDLDVVTLGQILSTANALS